MWMFEHKAPDPCKVINMAGRAIDEFWSARGWYVGEREEVIKREKFMG